MARHAIDFRPPSEGGRSERSGRRLGDCRRASDPSSGSARRRFQRRVMGVCDGVAHILMARDLSRAGLGIEPNERLAPGDRLKLAIYGGRDGRRCSPRRASSAAMRSTPVPALRRARRCARRAARRADRLARADRASISSRRGGSEPPRLRLEPFGALEQRGHGPRDRLRGAHGLGADLAEHAQRLPDRLATAALGVRRADDLGERFAHLRRGLAHERGSAPLLLRGLPHCHAEVAHALELRFAISSLESSCSRVELRIASTAWSISRTATPTRSRSPAWRVGRLRDLARASRGGRARLEDALEDLCRRRPSAARPPRSARSRLRLRRLPPRCLPGWRGSGS